MNNLTLLILAGAFGCLIVGLQAFSKGLKNKDTIDLKSLLSGKNLNPGSAGLLLLIAGLILLAVFVSRYKAGRAETDRIHKMELRQKERSDPFHKLLDAF